MRKTSIDEIPQFPNVLLGQMSFVGNRPRLPLVCSMFIQTRRRSTSSSLSQVLPVTVGAYYRNSTTNEEKIANDIYYAKHESFAFDVKSSSVL